MALKQVGSGTTSNPSISKTLGPNRVPPTAGGWMNSARQRSVVKPPGRSVETMSALVDESLGTSRLSTMLFGLFGIVGLVLASVGIYGVMSYGVIQRTREFGVRMALGARPTDVRAMVVREGAMLTAIGIGVGLVGAFALTRLMRTLLFAVTPTDPMTYIGIALVLGAVALLASYLPARRGTRVDPVIALRDA